ncbi:MAG TPA: chorismate-binding protein [Chryseosolibacter sp.]|nr:chorismate-binding protein [Chryseosolibacter sp.]
MNSITSVSRNLVSETEFLEILTSYATANDFPFALWRLPESPTKYFLIANQHRHLSSEDAIEELPTGFIFAPFDRARPSVFLPANFLFSFEDGKINVDETPLGARSLNWFETEFQSLKKSTGPKKYASSHCDTKKLCPDYLNLVNRCINEIEKGTLEKVVPSRQHVVDLPAGFDVIETFEKVCGRYSHALVSFVSIPGTGSWLTATPETLVTVEHGTIFKTVALAGTKAYTEGANLKSIAWTQKEIEEQALVERYIISCFKKIRLREYDEQGPKTVVAGNLMHLKTDFKVDMKAAGFPQLGSIMLQLLHPTSAVCGMPLEAATEFLKQHEGYDRSFYAGYLGPVNVNNNIHLFVNLRCMQLLDTKGILYAGAGVTIDSVPEEEFEETEMKFNTLRNVIL